LKKIEKEKIKIRPIIGTVIYIVFYICVGINILFLLNSSILKKENLEIAGISFFRMQNDLMQNEINKNDLVIIKKAKDSELQIGNIIAYEVNGNVRINKIINKKETYTTKSNKNYYPDFEKISSKQIIGKKIASIRYLGILLEILKSQITSWFILVFFILKFSYNKYMKKIKKERIRKKKKRVT